MYQITRKKILAEASKLMDIDAPLVARKAQPGQFIILRVDEAGERIPLTIADSDPEKGTVTIIYQEIGKTTKKLGALEEGDSIIDFVGPLGQAMEMPPKGSKVICVGGGVGIAPVYPKVKALYKAGMEVVSIIGARNADLLILEEEMREQSTRLLVCTDDGSKGHHGFVTDLLKEELEKDEEVYEVMAVGPLPMMRFVAKTTEPFGVKTLVSLNPVMIDGTGMCGGCRVTVGGETKFTCVDGPIFDGHKVDFDELFRRGKMYADKEKKSLDDHICRIGGDQ